MGRKRKTHPQRRRNGSHPQKHSPRHSQSNRDTLNLPRYLESRRSARRIDHGRLRPGTVADNMESEPTGGIAPELRAAWRFSAIQQAAIVFTVVAMSDRTRIHAALIALAVFWAGVGFIVFL